MPFQLFPYKCRTIGAILSLLNFYMYIAPDDFVATKVDAGCVIPLKKQQGFLNMFGQMITILGSKLEPQMVVLFPITLRLSSFCAQLLEQRDQVMKFTTN